MFQASKHRTQFAFRAETHHEAELIRSKAAELRITPTEFVRLAAAEKANGTGLGDLKRELAVFKHEHQEHLTLLVNALVRLEASVTELREKFEIAASE